MVDREDILRLIQQKGPIVPTDITSELKQESYLIGAMLSELVANKKLKISHAKLGGSPLYFLETQQAGLSRLYKHLNEKDRRAYDILHRDVILLDEPQTPLMRTALRNLKDFAVPFKVTYKGKQLLYWRWYLASEEEVKRKVHESLADLFPSEKKLEPTVETKPVTEVSAVKEDVQNTDENKTTIRQKPVSSQNEVSKQTESVKPASSDQVTSSQPVKRTPEKIEAKSMPKPNPTFESKKEFSSQKTLSDVPSQPENNQEPIDDEFALQVSGFLNSVKIKIIKTTVIKKKKEVDFLLDVPSPVGSVNYFCKARNKKKSNEGDLSTAYVEGQLQGLPVMYVSPGDIPKKLEGMLPEKYKNLKVLKL